MFSKIRSLSLLAIALFSLQSMQATSGNPIVISNERPTMTFDFDQCFAFSGPASYDYSEFQPEVLGNTLCSDLTMLSPSLYRTNPIRNPHSCAPGVNGSVAMCISSSESCNYNAGDEKSIRLNVLVKPGPDGLGSLEHISFSSMAPVMFEYVDGTTGPNDYPTRFRVRITSPDGEVYRSEEQMTTRGWTRKDFDLEGVSGLVVSEPTLFQIEILPYCLVGNGAANTAWDIDNLQISGGCNAVKGGTITTTSETEMCSNETGSHDVTVSLSDNRGPGSVFFAVDQNDMIVRVSADGFFNFTGLNEEQYFIFHVAHNGGLRGLNVSSSIGALQGCYDLSNSIIVRMNMVAGGTLLTSDGNTGFFVCPNLGNSVLSTTLTGNLGENILYILSSNGTIIKSYNSSNIDLSSLATGSYQLQALSYTGSLTGLTPGSPVSGIDGCSELSTAINISIFDMEVNGGNLSTNGRDRFDFCGPPGALPLELSGTVGENNIFIITNVAGNIIGIHDSPPPLDLSGLTEPLCYVWNLSDAGGISGLVINGLVTDLDGCFDLSNPVTVVKNSVPVGGNLTLSGGGTSYRNCPNEPTTPFTVMQTGADADNVLYVLTRNGNIIRSFDDPIIDLSIYDEGQYELVAMNYNGVLVGFGVGLSLMDLEGCFGFSNPISITLSSDPIEGGSISAEGGQTFFDFCGAQTSLSVDLTGAAGPNSSYLITNTSGRILNVTSSNVVDFATLQENECLIWHISYADGISGLTIDGLVSDLAGCFDLSNSIRVLKSSVDAGTITAGGFQTTTLCLKNNDNQAVNVSLTGQVGSQNVWVITDANGNILMEAFPDNNGSIDFNNATGGICLLYHVAYEGTLSGLTTGTNVAALSADCLDLSNAITVNRMEVESGVIAGPSSYEICVNDVGNTSLDFDVTGNFGNFGSWLVTDVDGNILETNTTSVIDFGGAPAGVCNVYFISHSDSPILYSGTPNINTINLGCFELSEPVTVNRKEVDGGMLTLANGATSVTVLVGQGTSANVMVDLSGATGDDNIFVVTDDLGNILETQTSNTFDFDGAGLGVCSIYNLSSCGTVGGLVMGANISGLTGCLDLAGPIVVTRQEMPLPDSLFAGVILTSDSLSNVDICIGLVGLSQDVDVIFTEVPEGPISTYVVTDDQGIVLELSQTATFSFDAAGAGLCNIYHLVYDQSFGGIDIGDDIGQLAGNFDLSNAIQVDREVVEGGSLLTSNGEQSITIVVGDGMTDEVTVVPNGQMGAISTIIVTDGNGLILDFPNQPLTFDDNAQPGMCLVWNITYNTALVGLEVNELVADLDGCFALSNPVTIVKEEFNPMDTLLAGVLTADVESICLGMDSGEVITTLTGAMGNMSTYVVTDDSGMILEVIDSTIFMGQTLTFGIAAGTGICNIYHLSSMGAVTGLAVGEDITGLGGMFEISNSVAVDRRIADGGVLTAISDTIDIIVGDGVIDSIAVNLSGAAGDFMSWLVTDTAGIILEINSGPPFTFENSAEGTCLIWHLSSAFEMLDLNVGDAAALTGCADLSNAIVVNKMDPMVSLFGGTLFSNVDELCIGQDTILPVALVNAVGDSSAYVVTDDAGEILEIIDDAGFAGTTLNFGPNTPAGICLVYHLSSNGTITGLTVGENVSDLSGDFDLSNSISVDRQAVTAAVIALANGMDSTSIVVGDGIIDSLDVVVSVPPQDSLIWLVTDTLGEVLEINSGPPFIFEGAGEGTCLIWLLSTAFDPEISVGDLASEFNGCQVLSNPITVNRTAIMSSLVGGTLDADVTEICLGQDSTVVTTLMGAVGDTSTVVITDEAGVILEIIEDTGFMGQTLTFGAATPPGLCNVYHISSTGDLTGLVAGDTLSNLGGDFVLSNAIEIDRQSVVGGSILTSTGVDSLTIIVGDGIIDSIEVNRTGAEGDSLLWLVTDTAGEVLEINSGPPFVFENAGEGTCLIWSLSTNFGADVSVGQLASDFTGCLELSNPIIVNRIDTTTSAVNGGMLTAVDGSTSIDLCLSSGDAVIDSLVLSGAVGDTMVYIITDVTGTFISPPFDNPPFNFVGTQTGNCQVWHISYSGTVTGLMPGSNIANVTGSDFDFSNAIDVVRNSAAGGSLSLAGGGQNATVMVGDTIVDLIDVVLTGEAGDESSLVVTDTLGNIIELPAGSPIDFTNAAEGTCLIWNISYTTGLTGLMVNNNVSQLDGCFALSDSIVITKEAAMMNTLVGGNLTFVSGDTTLLACLNTSTNIDIDLMVTGNVGSESDYILVNESGDIIMVLNGSSVSFSGNLAADCEAYHVSSDGTITGLASGQPLSGLGGNFALSNVVTINKDENAPGIFTYANNTLRDTITVGDGIIDSLALNLTGNSGDSTVYVLTTMTGVILDIQSDLPFVVADTLAPGDCNLSSVTFSFGLEGLEVGNNINFDLMGCFATTNLLPLVKEASTNTSLMAGVLTALNGLDTTELCIGNNGGTIDLNLMGAVGPEEEYLITDSTGEILGSPLSLPVTFISASPPTCVFYHVVHDGTLTGDLTGNTLDSLAGNFLISNAVVVNKTEIGTNNIMFSDSTTTVDITVGDGMVDTLTVVSTAISADTSVYVLVDANGVVQTVQSSPEFTFGAQISGTCSIYELSYDLGFTGLVPGGALSDLIGCFGLSNELVINKTSVISVNGGVVTTPSGNNLTICKTDMVNDTIFASVTSAMGGNMVWVITDDNGDIIDLPAAPPFVLDTSSVDACNIWHLSYESPLTGLAIGNNVSDLSGLFDFSDTPIAVEKNSVMGSSIMTDFGTQNDTIILGNIPEDSLRVVITTPAVGDTTSWIVTDTLGNIILMPQGEPPFTLDVLNQGICQLWQVAYSFGLSGLQVNNNVTDLEGCFALSDSILIVKQNNQSGLANGGTIMAASGATSVMTCLGDMQNDSLEVFVSGQSGMNFSFLVTNKNGIILSIQDTVQNLQPSTIVDIEFNGDSLELYHIAYSLPLSGLSFSQNISNLDGVFDLSNPITLLEVRVSSDQLFTNDPTTVIVGDGTADIINAIPISVSPLGDTIRYMVYDTAGVILAVDSIGQFDFDSYVEGEYFITQVASTFATTGVTVGANISDIDGCFDFSTTPIMVTTIQALLSGGNLMTTDSTIMQAFCFDSGVTMGSVDVILTDTIGENFNWIIADTSGLILDLPVAPPFDFDAMDPAICEIYNIAYDSTLVGLNIGENLDTLMSMGGSFLFSDTITITKSLVMGGSLSTPSGETVVEYCAGDGGSPDVLFVSLTGAVGDDMSYIVTDSIGDIVLVIDGAMTSFPIEAFQGDTCQVWNISSSDEVLGLTSGNNVSGLMGCFEISNPITLIKSQVDASIISATPAGVDNIIDFCTWDNEPDSLFLNNSSLAGLYSYVMTDDNGVITELITSDTLDFEGADFGVCRIYGVSYTGNFIAAVGDTIGVDSLSSECYDFTGIPLTINKLDCSQPIVNEVSENNTVEIKNIGTAIVDISTYQLCNTFDYTALSSLNVICGDLMLDPGELVVVDLTGSDITVDSADGEMALYVDNTFGSAQSMRSYVEWGSTDHQRSALAVSAGLWTTGEFTSAFNAGESLKYDGDGILASDWSVGTPTDCADGLVTEDPNTGVMFQMYPNPATERFTVQVNKLPKETGLLKIYNSFGKLIMTKTVSENTSYEMDLTTFGPGVYYSRVSSGVAVMMEKMILIR